MKKLTATIFASLLAVVSVGTANANIASQGYVDDIKTALTADIAEKADKGTTLAEYGITDAYTKGQVDSELTKKEDTANKATAATATTTDKGSDTKYTSVAAAEAIANAAVEGVTTNVTDLENRIGTAETNITDLTNNKANKATTLEGYGITDAYTKTESDANYATAAQGALADTALQKNGTLTQGNLLTTDATGKIVDAGAMGALASKDTVSATEIDSSAVTAEKIADGVVSKTKLDSAVQASLEKADSALQDADLTELEGKVDQNTTDIAGKVSTSQGAGNANKAVITGADGNITTGAVSKTMLDSSVQATLDKADQAATDLTDLEGKVEQNTTNITTNTNNIGTMTSLTTTEKTNLVGAVNEVKGVADDAKAVADKAIPAPTQECTNKGAKCVLVVGNNGYAWEVIQRGTAESVQ